jgi:hypothetical protein
VRQISTHSISGPTGLRRIGGPKTSDPFVSHVSRQEEDPDPQYFLSDGKNKVSIASSEPTDSRRPVAEASSPSEKGESRNQVTEAIPSSKPNDYRSQVTQAASSSSDQYDSLSQAPFIDEGRHTGGFASQDHTDPIGDNQVKPTVTRSPQTSSTLIPEETAIDHQMTVSQNDSSAIALARVLTKIRQLGEKRQGLLGIRVKVQEARNSIRLKRSALTELNARILQDIQRSTALGISDGPTPSPELVLNLQEVLDDLQVDEAELNATEDLLNRKEWELKEAEIEIYQSGNFQQAERLANDSTPLPEEELEETASNSTVSAQPVRSPLETQYLSRKGDAQILNEQLFELRAQRAQLVEEERVRRAVGMTLDLEDQQFLKDFDTQHRQLQQDLFYAEEDIFKLQSMLDGERDIRYTASHFDPLPSDGAPLDDDALLGEVGPLTEDGSLSEISSLSENGSLSEDGPLSGDNSLSRGVSPSDDTSTAGNVPPSKGTPPSNDTSPNNVASLGMDVPLSNDGITADPLLLNKYAPSLRFSTITEAPGQDKVGIVSYVNAWLLHRLRRSSLEILLFKSYLRDMHLSGEQLRDLVLEWWPRDMTGLSYSEGQRRSRRTASCNAMSGPSNLSTQSAQSDSFVAGIRRLDQRSQHGIRSSTRNRSTARSDSFSFIIHRLNQRSQLSIPATAGNESNPTLDSLLNNLMLHRPSTASSM